ncbi:MAG: Mpo1-like protein [Polyangiales bacterium]
MTDPARIQSFEEFWPFYVGEHSKPMTRRFHFVGTTAALACVGGAVVLGRPSLLLLAAVAGYGPAWVSHFFIEKNRPASFSYPGWSLAADLMMWTKMIDGTMDAEVEKVMAAKAATTTATTTTATATTATTTIVEETATPDPAFANPIGTA